MTTGNQIFPVSSGEEIFKPTPAMRQEPDRSSPSGPGWWQSFVRWITNTPEPDDWNLVLDALDIAARSVLVDPNADPLANLSRPQRNALQKFLNAEAPELANQRSTNWWDLGSGEPTAEISADAYLLSPDRVEPYSASWADLPEAVKNRLEELGIVTDAVSWWQANGSPTLPYTLPDEYVVTKATPEATSTANESRRLEWRDWMSGDGERPDWVDESFDQEAWLRDFIHSSVPAGELIPNDVSSFIEGVAVQVIEEDAAEAEGFTKTDEVTANGLTIYTDAAGTKWIADPSDQTGQTFILAPPEMPTSTRPFIMPEQIENAMLQNQRNPDGTLMGTVPLAARYARQQRAEQIIRTAPTQRTQRTDLGTQREYRNRDVLDDAQWMPQYQVGDAWRALQGMDPSEIAAIQNDMEVAGLITPGSRSGYGFAGTTEEEAVNTLMYLGNREGRPWRDMLGRLAQAQREYDARNPRDDDGGAGPTRAPFVAPVYIAPDYATLKVSVRGFIGQLLGRDPEDYELALLADTMKGDYDLQHQATIAAARAEYDAMTRALETEAAQGSGTVQGVDPLSRLQERIRERYAQEMENIDTRADMGTNMSSLMRSLAGMTGMVESG